MAKVLTMHSQEEVYFSIALLIKRFMWSSYSELVEKDILRNINV